MKIGITTRRALTGGGIAVAAGALLASTLPLAVASTSGQPAPEPTTPTSPATPAATTPAAEPSPAEAAPVSRAPRIRNVVFVLADDLDWATFNQVPRLKALTKKGVTLDNLVVTDSLCCPSRASILTSRYVHSHGVLSNVAPSIDPIVAETLRETEEADALVAKGGWQAFVQNGHEANCLPVWLQGAGVRTGFLGKYLNGYGSTDPLAVPPGWDDWFVPVTTRQMYRGYGYTVNDNGSLRSYPRGARSFLPDVLTREAVEFIRESDGPFYLQVNPTSPHAPFPVAKRHATKGRDARIPKAANLNARGANEPRWRANKKVIAGERLDRYRDIWAKRVRSAESIADTVAAIRKELRRTGKEDETLVVVGSDNGFHVGARRLSYGKRTPYREDTVVPYVFIGPGLEKGKRIDAITSTIDLGPTFAELLGASTPSSVEGRSLVGLVTGGSTDGWRSGVLTESLGDTALGDPDYAAFRPPKFHALRTKDWLYVEYVTGARELFDRRADPRELDNIVDQAPAATVAALAAQLRQLADCTGEACRAADGGAT